MTVCVPSIPPRVVLLDRALRSVDAQELQPAAVSVYVDKDGIGGPAARNHAVADADTGWLAMLDDDDEFLPHHLSTLVAAAEEHDADYAFGDFTVPEQPHFRLDSFCYGEFDPTAPLQTTITVLVRRSLFYDVGGYYEPTLQTMMNGDVLGEDFDFTEKCVKAGARIHHVQQVTWLWHHHFGNTSGRKWNR